ncbi:excinuclease ABC subunit UvrC [Hippea maritima]|uniref:UvrABC system protein C n=1 Tax=Hippea maritima (strain ATCC 700847 / DSM 10411 / MH2) TaxID=760142 RepID=F2LVK5_HIPMA|nr:excinuclease ABC subunit UvrC [Hippea maritima]AEA33789.1 UvrABC system protein C [Hippea maritima DSM 10411]
MSQKIELFKNPSLIKDIPKFPGVYIIFSSNDEILYVGKAKSLRDRLKSYLNPKEMYALKVSLIEEACSVEIITVNSELEALLLESNLIKEYRPPYNIVLRDDKSYPYLRISFSERFPRLWIARRIKNKKDFYFGPITPADKLKTLIKLLKNSFKIAQKNDKQCQGSSSACIYYQMGKCLAPCIGNISQEDYLKIIEEIKHILTNPKKIKKQLLDELNGYIERLEFEKAIQVRDKLKAIELLENKQSVSEIGEDFCDVITFERSGVVVCVYIMSIRFSNVVGNRTYFFYTDSIDDGFKESFIVQYYLNQQQVIPDVLLVDEGLNHLILKDALANQKSVDVIAPKKGARKRLLELAKKNAKMNLDIHMNQFKHNIDMLEKLKKALNLAKTPYFIDVADISHTGFENVVGGVVRYTVSGFDRSMYRRYKLDAKFEKEAMFEMLSRHKRLLLNSAHKLADLILVDGGMVQVNTAKEVFKNLPVIGISKEKIDGKAKRSLGDVKDRIYSENGVVEVDGEVLSFLQKLRDEVHRFAIEYHRKKREDYVLASALDRIEFIGPKRKKALFEKFGSIDNIKTASIEEISSVKGISRKIASIIKEKLKET